VRVQKIGIYAGEDNGNNGGNPILGQTPGVGDGGEDLDQFEGGPKDQPLTAQLKSEAGLVMRDSLDKGSTLYKGSPDPRPHHD